MPKWTKEQEQAIERVGCDLLVSAAAGSGKTAVLSERVLRRVTGDNAIRVDKLLIVTFTEAAAAEMRQRIVDKLRGELMKNPENTEISRQLALVPKANITTIHSFCLNIIKSNFHLLDMDPGFGIIDEAEKQLMCTEAAIETINAMYEEDGEAFSTLARWLAGGKDDALAERIIKTYEYIQSFENPLGWLNEQIEKYNVQSDNIDDLPWTELLKKKYRVEFSGMLAGYENVLKISDLSGSAKHYEIYLGELKCIEHLVAACAGNWQEIYDAAKACAFGTVRKDKDADEALANEAKELRDTYKKIVQGHIKSICTVTENDAVSSVKKAYPQMQLFEKTITLFSAIYAAKKREKNYIDFNDFEHLALKLLQDESLPVAAKLRESYEEIYVDEYQDCNGVQEAIFSSIAKRVDGKSCNMFMVGDIKQSIYKFRQADPEIFIGKLLTYADEGLQSKVMLNKNFRSRKEVVECVNSVFSKIMSPHIGGIEYTDDEALYAEFPYPEQEGIEYGGKGEILVVPGESDEEDLTKVGMEARAVALKIKSMVGKFHVYDAATEKYRPSTYRDFAILMRSPSAHSSEIEQEMKRLGIPCFSDRGAGLFDVHEIKLLMSALEIIDNPLQDIPLLGLMRSVPVGFGENELFKIRSFCKKGYFYNALKRCAKGEDELSEKCRKFISMLEKWRFFAKSRTVYGLIERIMEDIAFLPYILTLPGGKNRVANIELFCEYARKYEKSDVRGVFNFLRYIEKVEKGKGSDTARILSEACDVVRIMSIHKSKGLEFPVVFVLKGAGWFNKNDWTGSFMLHKEYGIGCDFMDLGKRIKYPLVSKSAISYKLMLEGLSEEMRVLYVALTRAREKLFFVVSGEKCIEKIDEHFVGAGQKISSNYAVQKAMGYFDWILLSMDTDKEKCCWEITKVTPESLKDGQQQPEQQKIEKETLSEEIKNEIARRLFYSYPHAKSSGLSSKYSVTELKSKFNSDSEGGAPVYYRQDDTLPAFMSDGKISAAKKGTILHLVLKFADFYNPDSAEAVENCKKYLLENNFISQREIESVNLEIVRAFLESDLCSEIRNADALYKEIPFNICVSGDIPTRDSDLKDDTVLLQGIIDCLYVKDGKFYIVDYKTDSGALSEEELEQQYRPQLELYRVAAEKITAKNFGGAYLYFLSRGKLREVLIDKEQ